MFASEALDGGHGDLECLRTASIPGGNLYDGYLAAVPYIIIIWAVEHHVNLECSLTAGREVEAKLCSVALLRSLEGGQTLGALRSIMMVALLRPASSPSR